MAKLTILEFPDPRLRIKAKPVEVVDDALRQLIDDMFETMYAAPGIGLAGYPGRRAPATAGRRRVNGQKRTMGADQPRNHCQRRRRGDRGGLPVRARLLRRGGTGRARAGSLPRPRRQSSGDPTSTACSPSACSTRWTISMASCLWTTCRKRSVSGFASASKKIAGTGSRKPPRSSSLVTSPP